MQPPRRAAAGRTRLRYGSAPRAGRPPPRHSPRSSRRTGSPDGVACRAFAPPSSASAASPTPTSASCAGSDGVEVAGRVRPLGVARRGGRRALRRRARRTDAAADDRRAAARRRPRAHAAGARIARSPRWPSAPAPTCSSRSRSRRRSDDYAEMRDAARDAGRHPGRGPQLPLPARRRCTPSSCCAMAAVGDPVNVDVAMNVGLSRRRLRGPVTSRTSPTSCRAARCSTSPAIRPRSSRRVLGPPRRGARLATPASSPTGQSDDELRAVVRPGERLGDAHAHEPRAAELPSRAPCAARGASSSSTSSRQRVHARRRGAGGSAGCWTTWAAARSAVGAALRRRRARAATGAQRLRRGARHPAGALLRRACGGEAADPRAVAEMDATNRLLHDLFDRGEPAVRALVTGAGGFLGRQLVAELLRGGRRGGGASCGPSRDVPPELEGADARPRRPAASRTRSRPRTSRAWTSSTTSPPRSRRPGARCSRRT